MSSENDEEAIEEEFLTSWDWMERYFKSLAEFPSWDYTVKILGLMGEMCERDYDRGFRAGQSMAKFVLSRSKKHGLRGKQPRVMIALNPLESMWVTLYDPPHEKIELDLKEITLTPELDALLQRLLSHPID